MNIAYFLTPKQDTAYLYNDYTLRQALEKMRAHGYTQIPVISRDGKYIDIVTEGDFLWHMLDHGGVSIPDAEDLMLRDVLKRQRQRPFRCARITATVDEIVALVMDQNFLPVTDDDGSYIGIVTRKNIIRHFVAEYVARPL